MLSRNSYLLTHMQLMALVHALHHCLLPSLALTNLLLILQTLQLFNAHGLCFMYYGYNSFGMLGLTPTMYCMHA